jgi:hypothetical protein
MGINNDLWGQDTVIGIKSIGCNRDWRSAFNQWRFISGKEQ